MILKPLIHFCRTFCTLSLLSVTAAAHAGAADVLPASVTAALDKAQVPREAMVAVVQEVGGTQSSLVWQPDLRVNPASLMKLLTTFASLELLGSAWSWSTPVWLQGNVRNGVLSGNLVIKGSGDPKLVVERLWLMLKRVQQLGVTEIQGDIVLDRSAFVVPEQSPAEFDGESLRAYNVAADALMLNYKAQVYTLTPDAQRGVGVVTVDLPLAGVRVDTSVPLTAGPCADWRAGLRADMTNSTQTRFAGSYPSACGEKIWSTAYADPKRYNERALLGLWQSMGGRISGAVRDGVAPTTKPTFEITSPPLAEVVRDMNKYSNNVMAQQLFLTLGLTQRGVGTLEFSREVVRQWAQERLGSAGSAALVLDNGSGLSRESRISAQFLTRLLQAAWASPVMPELVSSLPVSGIDGTLKRSRAILGRAHLKTGSLRDVTGVAGYVLSNSGRRYVVVCIVNHANANAARPALDALVQWAASDAANVADLKH
jgi:serine-type D-Ala-D-Ala carboxypeptidase/endopeptidase (penicillin-binding protein 4)